MTEKIKYKFENTNEISGPEMVEASLKALKQGDLYEMLGDKLIKRNLEDFKSNN